MDGTDARDSSHLCGIGARRSSSSGRGVAEGRKAAAARRPQAPKRRAFCSSRRLSRPKRPVGEPLMDGPLRILIRALKSRGTPRRGALAARLRGDDGFTLIETLVAAVVLIVGLATLFGLLDSSVKATYATRAREGGTNLARQVLEDARTIPYSQMAPTTIKEQ